LSEYESPTGYSEKRYITDSDRSIKPEILENEKGKKIYSFIS